MTDEGASVVYKAEGHDRRRKLNGLKVKM
jgi:hypothetical protein